MTIKYTFQGLLIYLAISSYLIAFFANKTGKKKAGRVIYFAGFMIALAAFAYRWYDACHIPFQNMFEVFLTMAILTYPLSLFCSRFMKIEGQTVDMLISVILLFPAGFIFHAKPQMLPPALQSPLFTPHVAVYLIAYVMMAKAATLAFCQLQTDRENALKYENDCYKMICLGFPLLTIGLLLGSWWGKLAWGDYWGWDPKESFSLASWLVYVFYFHFRFMFGRKRPRINSCLAILGLVAILITLLWVNLSRIFPGLHTYAS